MDLTDSGNSIYSCLFSQSKTDAEKQKVTPDIAATTIPGQSTLPGAIGESFVTKVVQV